MSRIAGRFQQVRWTLEPAPTPIEHMGVWHCRTDVFVPEAFLHCPDVVPRFEPMGRKGVPTLIVTLLIIRRWPRSGTRTIPSSDKR